MKRPLFVCYANCCRSVLAEYLYENLNPGSRAESAGIECGDEINDRAEAMLRHWGIESRQHCPRKLTRELCEQSDAIFLMTPDYLRDLLTQFGSHLAGKAYLFADPFSIPKSFRNGEYFVRDPSFDSCDTSELIREFEWFRERVIQIYEALHGTGMMLVPASSYLGTILNAD